MMTSRADFPEVRMPGEFEQHRGCMMIWPVRPGSWPYGGVAAQTVFSEIARAIAKDETVFMLCNEKDYKAVKEHFKADENIEVLQVETDDAWARDVGPTCVKDKDGRVYGVDWCFNAWGGDYDGLYASYQKDDAAAAAVCQQLEIPVINAHPFVLEGGSIHSDGEGTLIVTKSCLLSKGRNPSMSQQEIEDRLKHYTGCKKIIWLPYGIYNDETNEHVDNVCAFVKPGKVVLAWTDDREDPQYEMSQADLQVLENETDAKGRHFEIVKLPIPDSPVCVRKDELMGYSFEEGEDTREEGERLAASYVNFYISNGSVIVPAFGDENKASDERAVSILAECFPDRKIVRIKARDIIVGGGNIHCITQQIPK